MNFCYVTGHTFGDLEQQRVHLTNFDTAEDPTGVSTMLHATSAAEELARVSTSLTLPLISSTAYMYSGAPVCKEHMSSIFTDYILLVFLKSLF